MVDSGQGAHLLRHARSLHPYLRYEVDFEIEPEQEVGPGLRRLGIGARDVRQVVLTHLHSDHDGGLHHFKGVPIRVARGEIEAASGWRGTLRGYLNRNWPGWFDPAPLDLTAGLFENFTGSLPLTRAGDVIALATPGHTPHHLSVLVRGDSGWLFLAGDTSYTQNLMLAGRVDGVSPNERTAGETLAQIRRFSRRFPTVYLPTHDPEAARRLEATALVETASSLRST